MKRKLFVLSFLLITINVFAQEFTVLLNKQRLNFKILSAEEHTVELTANENIKYRDSVYVIPDSVNYNNITYSVVAIGEKTFRKNKSIERIVLPSSLKTIGEKAFWGCVHLKKVDFSEGLQIIGDNCFEFCKNLKHVDLPNGLLRIEKGAFRYIKMEVIVIPNTVTFVGEQAFGCANEFIAMDTYIKSLTIPESVIEIGEHAFSKFVNGFRNYLPSKCHLEHIPSWMTLDEAKRVGIHSDSYEEYVSTHK